MNSPIINRFLKYVRIDTRSIETKPHPKPSSHGQIVLGSLIKQELITFGIKKDDIREFSDGSFLVHLPATKGYETSPHSVYAAHMDTAPGVSGDVKPIVHEYKDGDIELPNGNQKVIIPEADLVGLAGKHIVTADGTSLLGADDKAGLAAIVTAIEAVISTEHGPITFWFCVDEEIGELDINVVPEEIVKSWDILWTIDGTRVGSVDVGCFVGRSVEITFHGADSHPGGQGDKLKPAHYAAAIFVARVAELPTPMDTRDKESFHYVSRFVGNATTALVSCIPRSFVAEESERMAKYLEELAHRVAKAFGCTAEVVTQLSYVNTRENVLSKMVLVEPGVQALKKLGYNGELSNIRGGTDGAMINLTYPELPAPNIGTGCKNLHGTQEYLVVEELDQVPGIILDIIEAYKTMKV